MKRIYCILITQSGEVDGRSLLEVNLLRQYPTVRV